MPQTREHLDILTLLGVQHGIIALTKVDAVPPERTQAATQEVRQFVAGTFLQDAPILPLSNITGQGFEEFYDALKALMAAITPKTAQGVFRVPVERAFSAKGYGTIVAGIPACGSVGIGDEVVLLPQGTKGRVRAIQAYGRDSTRAMAGQCAAINIPQWDQKAVERGNVISMGDYFAPHQWYLCEFKLLDQEKGDLKNAAQVKFHTGTSETPARVYLFGVPPSGGSTSLSAQPAPPSAHAEEERKAGQSEPPKGGTPNGALKPGGRCLVQVFLDHPVVAGPRDHFILRSLSPTRTIGGGIIVEALERRLKRTDADVLTDIAERARAVATPRDFVAYCLRNAESGAADERQLALRTKTPPAELVPLLAELTAAGRVLPLGGRSYIHVDTAGKVRQHLLDVLRAFHQRRPESPGLSREQFLTESAVRKDIFDNLIERMRAEGKVADRKGLLALPEHHEQFNNAEQQLLQSVEALFRSQLFAPPGPAEIAERMHAAPPQVQRILRILTEQQKLVRVDQDLFFHTEAIAAARERLVSYIKQNGGLESVKFKYLLDTSRKYAIPLLDYFDKIGVTRRDGYTRLLR
jgi:selenocysteine-specific elongation factor